MKSFRWDFSRSLRPERHGSAHGPLGSSLAAGDILVSWHMPVGGVRMRLYTAMISQQNDGASPGYLIQCFRGTNLPGTGVPTNKKDTNFSAQARTASNLAIGSAVLAPQALITFGYMPSSSAGPGSVTSYWQAKDRADMIVVEPGNGLAFVYFNTPDADGRVAMSLEWEEDS